MNSRGRRTQERARRRAEAREQERDEAEKRRALLHIQRSYSVKKRRSS